MSRITKTIMSSLPPDMTDQVRQAMNEEGRTMSELLREAIRLYKEEREWRRQERLRRLRDRAAEQEETRKGTHS